MTPAESLARTLHAGQVDKGGAPAAWNDPRVISRVLELCPSCKGPGTDCDGYNCHAVRQALDEINGPDSDIVERRYAPARAVLEAALVELEGV